MNFRTSFYYKKGGGLKTSLKSKGIVALLLVFALSELAHSHEKHSTVKPKSSPASGDSERAHRLSLVNEEYRRNVKSIFQKSCFDCHSQQTHYPWYYKIPGARGLIDSDIAEAKKHIDLTNDFPFKGHGSPEEDLEAIRETMDEDTMPPVRYKILHPSAKLSKAEQEIILQWVSKSLEELSK